MGMEAVGSYMRTLRTEQDLTQGETISRLADHLQGRRINPTTLWRLETGQKKPRSDILNGLIQVLGGNSDHVTTLFNDTSATADRGREEALRWLRRDEVERIEELIEATDPEDLTSVIEELRREYEHDSSLIPFLRGALAGWRARGSGFQQRRE
jgi:transcriptional regulator with XRE-family HTH domain